MGRFRSAHDSIPERSERLMDPKMNDMLEKMRIAAAQTAQAMGKAADIASKKTNEFVAGAKNNLQIYELNSQIEGLMREIGRCVYLAHTGAQIDTGEVDGKISAIDEKYALIAKMKEESARQRPANLCPVCGGACGPEDAYCKRCGSQL